MKFPIGWVYTGSKTKETQNKVILSAQSKTLDPSSLYYDVGPRYEKKLSYCGIDFLWNLEQEKLSF